MKNKINNNYRRLAKKETVHVTINNIIDKLRTIKNRDDPKAASIIKETFPESEPALLDMAITRFFDELDGANLLFSLLIILKLDTRHLRHIAMSCNLNVLMRVVKSPDLFNEEFLLELMTRGFYPFVKQYLLTHQNNSILNPINRDGESLSLLANENGQTMLHLAVQSGQVSLIGQFIQCNKSLFKCDNLGQTPLSLALKLNIAIPYITRVIFNLINSSYREDSSEKYYHESILLHLVHNSFMHLANIFIDKHRNSSGFSKYLNATEFETRRTPLHILIKNGYLVLAERLILLKASIKSPDSNGDTPISIAFQTEFAIDLIKKHLNHNDSSELNEFVYCLLIYDYFDLAYSILMKTKGGLITLRQMKKPLKALEATLKSDNKQLITSLLSDPTFYGIDKSYLGMAISHQEWKTVFLLLKFWIPILDRSIIMPLSFVDELISQQQYYLANLLVKTGYFKITWETQLKLRKLTRSDLIKLMSLLENSSSSHKELRGYLKLLFLLLYCTADKLDAPLTNNHLIYLKHITDLFTKSNDSYESAISVTLLSSRSIQEIDSNNSDPLPLLNDAIITLITDYFNLSNHTKETGTLFRFVIDIIIGSTSPIRFSLLSFAENLLSFPDSTYQDLLKQWKKEPSPKANYNNEDYIQAYWNPGKWPSIRNPENHLTQLTGECIKQDTRAASRTKADKYLEKMSLPDELKQATLTLAMDIYFAPSLSQLEEIGYIIITNTMFAKPDNPKQLNAAGTWLFSLHLLYSSKHCPKLMVPLLPDKLLKETQQIARKIEGATTLDKLEEIGYIITTNPMFAKPDNPKQLNSAGKLLLERFFKRTQQFNPQITAPAI